ncbi:MAG TPA: succinate dehydrogenase cytochrome b subunit [Candidatus Kapabacteria bacterium]|nr:succinate dehydrogenase cytochrome b subunit [Candidatus Kapabacteria bacterium]
MSNYNPFNSTIFNKIVMALTGLILVGFIIGHALGNLQVFLGREVFNTYAHFLHSTGELLWVARIVLLISVLLHIVTSMKLKALNSAAKPKKYAVSGYIKSTVYSRSMIYSGLAIFFFLVYHLMHFTMFVTNPEYANMEEVYGPKLETAAIVDTNNGQQLIDAGQGIFLRHDAYQMVIDGFSHPIVVVVYILAVLFLAMHLSHAIQSMFQTLGFASPKFSPISIYTSKLLAWGIFVAFAAIPISVLLFGLGKGVVGL